MNLFSGRKIKSISSLLLRFILPLLLTHCTISGTLRATISLDQSPSPTPTPSSSPSSTPSTSPTPTSTPTPTPTPTQTPTPTPTSSTKTITVSWRANKESAVNSSGGGYTVYYSTTPYFSLDNASSINVPYTSGDSAPTQVQIANLARGKTYYIKVIAYSSITALFTSTNSTSNPSTEVSIAIP